MDSKKRKCEELIRRGLPPDAAPSHARNFNPQGGQMSSDSIRLSSRSVLETTVCRNNHKHVEEREDSNDKKECMRPRDDDVMKIGAVMMFAIAQAALA